MTILESAINNLFEAREEIKRLQSELENNSKELENNSKELETLRKAYKMLAISFCKNTSCVFCECLSECKDSKIDERGRDITMRHFLKEAQNDC